MKKNWLDKIIKEQEKYRIIPSGMGELQELADREQWETKKRFRKKK